MRIISTSWSGKHWQHLAVDAAGCIATTSGGVCRMAVCHLQLPTLSTVWCRPSGSHWSDVSSTPYTGGPSSCCCCCSATPVSGPSNRPGTTVALAACALTVEPYRGLRCVARPARWCGEGREVFRGAGTHSPRPSQCRWDQVANACAPALPCLQMGGLQLDAAGLRAAWLLQGTAGSRGVQSRPTASDAKRRGQGAQPAAL